MSGFDELQFNELQFNELKFNEHGLICAVVVDDHNGDVLMVAWMNRATLAETLDTGRMVYWSRSRQERWRKGDTSGDVQHLRSASVDCDGDTLLFRVEQVGAACHTGERSCFFRPFPVEDTAP
ncbi:MAG: phosphoribosyl-AMP cyclohydrolase [Microthrixaceae bacterium]